MERSDEGVDMKSTKLDTSINALFKVAMRRVIVRTTRLGRVQFVLGMILG